MNAPLLFCIAAGLCVAAAAAAGSEDLGNGFRHHGVATPLSNHRGIVAAADGAGNDIALVWLMDHRGCYELLWIDAQTGKTEQFPIPEPVGGDSPFASILASNGRFYTHFGNHFLEFDPAQRKFTFTHVTAPQMAMMMTEDDGGVIWSASYPQSGLVSYNPKTGEFKDYGHLYKQNWAQYPRSIAADDSGFVYFGIGSTSSQIIAFDPASGKATPLLAESERHPGSGTVIRDLSGKVYASDGGSPAKWLELYRGQRRDLPQAPTIKKKPIIADSQGLFYRQFPDGKVLKELDTVERVMVVEDPRTGQSKRFEFTYDSEGAHIMGMCAAPDGTMCGGSAFPMRFFSYNPRSDAWTNHNAFLQFNTVARQGDRWYTGGYGYGFLLEWDPTQPWVDTVEGKPCNPLWLADAKPDINRPHKLLPLADGKTLILAGTPNYGRTGGGLLFWDRETKQATKLTHRDLIPEHSTMSLAAVGNGTLVGGTTIEAGTGGEVKATVAELYVMDLKTKRIEWHAPLLPGVRSYTDLLTAPNGLVYGFADWHTFFVFSPGGRNLVYQHDLGELGNTNSQQGPRSFVVTPEGTIYILLVKGIAKLDPKTLAITLVAPSPVPIGAGGDYLDGRIYFASGSHVYSWEVR